MTRLYSLIVCKKQEFSMKMSLSLYKHQCVEAKKNLFFLSIYRSRKSFDHFCSFKPIEWCLFFFFHVNAIKNSHTQNVNISWNFRYLNHHSKCLFFCLFHLLLLYFVVALIALKYWTRTTTAPPPTKATTTKNNCVEKQQFAQAKPYEYVLVTSFTTDWIALIKPQNI